MLLRLGRAVSCLKFKDQTVRRVIDKGRSVAAVGQLKVAPRGSA